MQTPFKVMICVDKYSKRCAESLEIFRQNGCEVLGHPEDDKLVTQQKFEAMLPLADACVAGMHRWGEREFTMAKKMKAVAFFGVGVDHIDQAAAKRHGVKVINAKGANADAVAEYTVGLIIGLLRDVPNSINGLLAGGWPRPIGTGLNGKTLGIFGYGDIGQLVVKKLSGFEMPVLAYSRNPNREAAARQGVELVGSEELFARSDILSLHAPATPATAGLINRESLAAMKKGAWLINTARGALVDEEALADAVESGQLSGAALDVFQHELLARDSRLLKMQNVICTPHAASETWRVYSDIGILCAKGLVTALQGGIPDNWLNP